MITQPRQAHIPNVGAQRVQDRLAELAGATDEAGRITRLYLTRAHRRAIEFVEPWMREAGLSTSLDAAATLIGRRPGPRPDSPALLLGSHLDSVRDAGRYDGCLGVVTGIETLAALGDTPLPFAIELRAFGDEEGVRFPVTLTGAHATAGHFDPAWLDAVDDDGVTLARALAAFGAPTDIASARSRRAFAYLELHIEQGPVLERAHAPVGIVTAIAGAARHAVTVTGQAGHAGTVPMHGRRDALAAACAMILAVRDAAHAEDGVVATVGRIEAHPGAVNVIPGEVRFTIDLRAADDAARDRAWHHIDADLARIAAAEHVGLAIVRTHHARAVACDDRLQECLADAVAHAGQPIVRLPSGAGHDAMAVAALCPIGMLFVRCAGGLSHHPDEHVSTADIAAALDVLAHTIRHLDPASFGS